LPWNNIFTFKTERKSNRDKLSGSVRVFIKIRCIFYILNKKNTILQVLLALYLVVVVLLVRRQINQVDEEEEEDRIVMVDKKGKTDIKIIDKVLNDENAVFI
jgi:hypothetical protein